MPRRRQAAPRAWLAVAGLLAATAANGARAQPPDSARAQPPDSARVQPPDAAPGQALDAMRVAPGSWLGVEVLAAACDSFVLRAGQFRIDLTHAFLQDPVTIRLRGLPLTPGLDVSLDRLRGIVALPEPAVGGEQCVVCYRYDPAGVPHRVQLHDPSRTDLLAPPTASSVPGGAPDSSRAGGASWPGMGAGEPGRLQVRGSKTVSVQGGTGRDATLDQALQLSVQGAIAPGVQVRAEVSDENLPITPEGNTEELSDLDQVRLEVFGRRGGALLGDFSLEQPLGVFLPFQRKLQGLALHGRAERGTARVLGGAPRGQRVQTELRGREGVQGPYELLDPQRQDETFIVAGTERVWIDGEEMRRGETNDYTIDYIRGSITFSEQRPVGPERLIAVDYEVSRSGYTRQVVGVLADTLRWGPARMRLGWLREGDDPDRPLEGELAPADREALAAAGDDPTAAIGGGATFVADAQGQYAKSVATSGDSIFVFVGATGGDWNVTFTSVGAGRGDYRLDRLSDTGLRVFVHVGAGLGDYVVGRALRLPSRTEATVAGIELGDRKTGGFAAVELDATARDENVASTRDDQDNDDVAWRAEAATPWLLGQGQPERGVRASGLAEALGGRFHELGRIREPFFYEAWNLQGQTRDAREGREQLSLQARFARGGGSLALTRLHRTGVYDGRRAVHDASASLLGPLRWSHTLAFTSADRPQQQPSFRRDRTLRLSAELPVLVPQLRWSDQHFSDGAAGARRGFRFDEWAAGVRSRAQARLQAGAEFRRRLADSLAVSGADWSFATDVREWRGDLATTAAGTRVAMEATLRRAQLPSGDEERTRLGRLLLSRRPADAIVGADLEYRAGTDRTRVLERQIVFVGESQGNFDAEGNPVGQRQGDYNVVYLPSDSLAAATDVELTGKLDVTPPVRLLGGVSSSTLLSIQERSTASDVGDVLRLRPWVLRQPGTTLLGEERLREELVLLRGLRGSELRLTFDRTLRLDQRYANAPEASRRRLRGARLESELARGWSLRVEAQDELRERETGDPSNPLLRPYDVLDRTAAGALRYRPTARARASLELRATWREDADSDVEQTVLELLPGATADLLRGRWTVELRLAQVEERGVPGARPYFFERPGDGKRFSVAAQWGGRGSVTVGVRYQLRDEPERSLRQDMSVETRARF